MLNIKHFLTVLFIMATFAGFSQLHVSYSSIQQTYGQANLTQFNTKNSTVELKKLTSTETIQFTYNQAHLVTGIEITNQQGISNKRFHTLAKQLVPNFKLTASGTTPTNTFLYDSKNNILTVKYYSSNQKTALYKIAFISDMPAILALVPNISSWP
ncbi:hypothetical protein ACFSQP_07455 [Bizionia sediminis]|uniref:DUF4251 domain-containing protein n=1 Tax=Bizionia sediminis TaxID=1737064 RepID=A0ABW5KS04_9FLAO